MHSEKMTLTAVINFGMGNLCSIDKALTKIGANHVIINDKEELKKATHIILPGVGFFAEGMNNLRKMEFVDPLKYEVFENKKPLLGICLGMQLLFEKSEEGGDIPGLGFIKGEVRKFRFKSNENLKIPHVGWNKVSGSQLKEIDVLHGIPDETFFYFVHSYHVILNSDCKKCHTTYGYDFVSAVQEHNIFGTQFHPEKSQKMGLTVLKNFIEWKNTNACR